MNERTQHWLTGVGAAGLITVAAVALFQPSALSIPTKDEPAPAVTVTATATTTERATPQPTVTETHTVTKTKTVTRYVERASRSYSRGPSPAQWAKLRQCESGNRPWAVSGNGMYHGLYQFDVGTWRGQGGHGLPSKASRAEQDMRARSLYADRGAAPWPICGKYLR